MFQLCVVATVATFPLADILLNPSTIHPVHIYNVSRFLLVYELYRFLDIASATSVVTDVFLMLSSTTAFPS